MNIKVACATDDGKNFIKDHFGDARQFDIYVEDGTGFVFLGSVMNTSPEEKVHADPKKAQGITGLLKSRGVKVLVNMAFGPNITRIRKNFIPVVVTAHDLQSGLVQVAGQMDNIRKQLSEDRDEYTPIII